MKIYNILVATMAATLAIASAQKVSELTAITGAAVDPATDLLMLTDISAGTSGSKKITLAEFANIPGLFASREPALGNPAANGYVLSSTTGGVRSWIVAPGSNLTAGPVTSSAGTSAIADAALSIAKTSGLQTALDANNAGKVIIVDAAHASATDTRAGLSRYSVAAPFATLVAAKDAAASGDTIRVNPSTYVVAANLLKNGVNWWFAPGAQVDWTAASTCGIFDDSAQGANGAVTCSIGGHGRFRFAPSSLTNGARGVFYMVNASSVIDFTGDRVKNENASSGTFYIFEGTMRATVQLSENTAGFGIWWANGDSYISAKRFYSTGIAAVYSLCSTTPTGKLWVNADAIVSNASVGGAVLIGDSNASAAVWIVAKEITQLGTGGSSWSVLFSTIFAGKCYITSQKISSASTSAATIFFNTSSSGVAWITTQKLTSAGGAFFIRSLGTATAWIGVSHFESVTTVATGISMTGGNLTLAGNGARITATNGVTMSGGTLRTNNVIFDSSASASSNPIVKSGGTLALGAGTLLVAEATRNSIEASTAQNVTAFGAWANTALDADVTLLTAGGLTVDSDVQ